MPTAGLTIEPGKDAVSSGSRVRPLRTPLSSARRSVQHLPQRRHSKTYSPDIHVKFDRSLKNELGSAVQLIVTFCC